MQASENLVGCSIKRKGIPLKPLRVSEHLGFYYLNYWNHNALQSDMYFI